MDNPGDACGRLTLWEDTSPAEAYKPAASDQAVLSQAGQADWSLRRFCETHCETIWNLWNDKSCQAVKSVQSDLNEIRPLTRQTAVDACGSSKRCKSAPWRQYMLYLQSFAICQCPIKNGKTEMLGLDRLKVRWDVALFFLHVIVWNVWLFLFDYLAKCVVEVVEWRG